MFKFHCPHCNQRIEADDSDAGQKVDCPACSNTFIVPFPRESPPPSPPPLPPSTPIQLQPRLRPIARSSGMIILVVFVLAVVLANVLKRFQEKPAESVKVEEAKVMKPPATKFELGRTYRKTKIEFADGTSRAIRSSMIFKVLEVGEGYVTFTRVGSRKGDSFYRKVASGEQLEWYARTFDLVK